MQRCNDAEKRNLCVSAPLRLCVKESRVGLAQYSRQIVDIEEDIFTRKG